MNNATSRKKRINTLLIFIIIALFLGSSLVVYKKRNRIIKYLKTEIRSFSFKNPKNTCNCNWSTFKLKRDQYPAHLAVAKKSTNNMFIRDDKELRFNIDNGNLVSITNQEGYRIRHLTHSSRHLTPKSYILLKEMGQRFRHKLKDSKDSNAYFELSSVLRTEEQQKDIRKRYPNAATQGNSTHSYGVSFDILYLKGNNCDRITVALNQVLQEMQVEKKILIVPEKNVIHITVAQNN